MGEAYIIFQACLKIQIMVVVELVEYC